MGRRKGRYGSRSLYERKKDKKKLIYLLSGIVLGACMVVSAYQTTVYYSTDQSCSTCHVHPHVEASWKLSKHFNNGSGTRVHCADCHLPPKTGTVAHYSAKFRLAMRDVWGYLTKDSADLNWDYKSELEQAVKYIPNESCKDCHHDLFPQGIEDDGITAHLYYEANEAKLNLQCIGCHLDAGHYNPNYKHGKLSIQDIASWPVDTSKYFNAATPVTGFTNFTEQIPHSNLSFLMIAVPSGTFQMGSPEEEPFRKDDESPVHNVTVSPFYMSEIEVTWDLYWWFYSKTMSEGRTPSENIFANNSRPGVDAVSGPTPPFGFPDQGWGSGQRPAITMTHYGAETFCQWLSLVTGKKYRLPTEAEWEYAARGGTKTPYFFEGNPKKFSNEGFWRRLFDAGKEPISSYVIYVNNSKNKTQLPDAVKANPFGLKNMLGNVMEYCADKYDPQAYQKAGSNVTNPLSADGTEYVVRGGNYASDASAVRCAARDYTRHEAWLKTDPQQPKSIWWYSDVRGVGFRVVCEVKK